MISTSRGSARSKAGTARGQSRRRMSQQHVDHLREDLQYALIMTNRNSKVLVDIVGKLSKAEKRLHSGRPSPPEASFEEKLMQTKRSQSQQLGRSTKECFSNTIDLVFSLKKQQCASRLRQNPEPDFREEIKNRINSIRLRTIEAA